MKKNLEVSRPLVFEINNNSQGKVSYNKLWLSHNNANFYGIVRLLKTFITYTKVYLRGL